MSMHGGGGVAATPYKPSHPHVKAATGALEGSLEYWQVRRAMKEELIRPTYRLEDFTEEVPRLMEEMGLATRLRNFAFAMRERLPREDDALPSPSSPPSRSPPSSMGGVSSARRRGGGGMVGGGGGDGSGAGGGGEGRLSDGGSVAGPGIPPLDDDAREAAGMLEAMAVARRVWRRKLTERINQLSTQTGLPLAHAERRDDDGSHHAAGSKGGKKAAAAAAAGDQEDSGSALTKSISASLTHMEFTESLRTDLGHLYSANDLLEMVASIEPSGSGVGGPSHAAVPSWGLVQAELRPPSTAWLQEYFRYLSPRHCQVGLDDNIDTRFAQRRRQDGDALVRVCSIPQCRSYARLGVPTALRSRLWAAALGVQMGSAMAATADPGTGGDFQHNRSRSTFDRLCGEVKRRSLLIDGLVAGDVREICDHAHYFVFEEVMRAVMLAFTRDAAVPSMCASSGRCAPHPRLNGMGRGGRDFGTYPPAGVLPFRGLASYLAPLCYLYVHPADMYPVFRELYTRHFCRLHVISDESTPSPALPALCRAFEDMLQHAEPEICFHLLRLGVPALRLAAPWMIHAFVRHLEVEQVLLVWDRVIGYDSVLPLAIAAAAILSFRRDALLAAKTPAHVMEAVEDLSQIQIVPLMQDFLFRDGLGTEGTAAA